MNVAGIVIDWHVFATLLGTGGATLLARATGLRQRMDNMERRIETQAELIATQQQQISGLTDENRLQASRIAAQELVIQRQGRYIGKLTRQNKDQAAQLGRLETENAQLTADCARLSTLHADAEKRGKALRDELLEEKRRTGQTNRPGR